MQSGVKVALCSSEASIAVTYRHGTSCLVSGVAEMLASQLGVCANRTQLSWPTGDVSLARSYFWYGYAFMVL